MSQEDIDALKNASMIIERFGGIRPMAAKVGAPVTTVQGWKKRDVIPGARRDDVLKAANENNININDLLTDKPVLRTSGEASAFIPTPQKEETSSATSDRDDVKITVEPIIRPQTKPLPSSFTSNTGPTHEELMAAIAQGQKKAVRASIWTAIIFAAILGGAATLALIPSAKKVEEHEAQIAALDKEVTEINESAGFIKDMVPEDMRKEMAALKAQAEDVAEDVKNVAAQAKEVSKTVLATNAGSLSDRLSVIEAKFADMQDGQAMKDLTARIRGLEVTAAGQEQLNAAVSELSKIVDAIDGQVNALDDKLAEAQLAPQSALGETLQGVSNNDMKAAALLIAFSQLRDSLNRNAPLKDDIALLQKLVGNEQPELQQALARLAPQAEKGGVLSSEGLSKEFKGLAGDIVFASLNGEDVSMTDKAKVRLTQMMNIKKDGELVGGTPTQQTVAKAQEQLNANDVQGAIATLQSLDGEAKAQAQPFIDQAQATVLADQIQNMLRQMIVSSVGGGSTAATGNALNAVKETVQSATQPNVVKDEASGFSVLPTPKGFKGFSDGQPE